MKSIGPMSIQMNTSTYNGLDIGVDYFYFEWLDISGPLIFLTLL